MAYRCAARLARFIFAASIPFLSLSPALAQIAVTPAKVTMLVGDSQPFRAIDSHGHMLSGVRWTISRTESAEVSQGAEIEVVAKQPGSFTLTAYASAGSAEAQVEVLLGPTMPMGTVRWHGVDWPGCKTAKIMPAVPSATGVADVFEVADCADGQYVAAYTAEGIMAWRRKTAAKGGQANAEQVVAAVQVNTHGPSICDSISISMKQDEVRALLAARQLTPSSQTDAVWLIEEEGIECRLWFDTQTRVTKKRKTLVSE